MSVRLRTSLFRQRGMSYWGWLLVVAMFGFILTCVSKMAPAYIDARYVEEGLKKLAENPNLRELSRADIKKELDRFFLINNVRGEPTKSVKVIRGADSMLVSIDYELRQPLIYNVDVVMKFDKQLNTAKPELCCEPLVDLEQFRKRDN
ncbi:DUF4845 domain-containing protein [Microbulbifer thermotolerans]|uniref:DUF4845 domain-containing protein n=1 Tax=Microbulbifer thermotolerans TaxID=252514 RepID=A0A143HLB5_MICTH|nr:DUF4845 domain-containing protein [Microbulbifer thermotolerans]AMX02270.1 hypothetical protein A3224_06435 [Microbulbifer thermotolerans]MCX2778747.1 DUF4845 domain-containing protein [Microbulbifer thermotolerans]MCX2784391.1 DUF4845 domain-containing protein [Microbulbifer thermotolerans]MCX2793633.1 DUF4845 domain-containing protein [Microbulbifer thermotolerans]MCX2800817.1 DUF4845 domain-containing protein [Microbulbifer thermotolerans]